MNWEITVSGFGGQGVLFIGRLLADSGFNSGLDITWLPYYSGEKRGGMCSCFVNISDERIGSIFITHPHVGVAMNPAALKVNLADLTKGGTIIVNTDAFNERNLQKAGYGSNPLEDGSVSDFHVHEVALSSMTVEALKEIEGR
jgi:2-oxoglutarate ferredoxin oxidoreductase subunit alpha